jgi:hypothetical protein
MKYRPRNCYTEEQKALMWGRWQKGESLRSISRLFDRGHSSIQRTLKVLKSPGCFWVKKPGNGGFGFELKRQI